MKINFCYFLLPLFFMQSCMLLYPSRLDSWKYVDIPKDPDTVKLAVSVETDSGVMVSEEETARLLDALLVAKGLKNPYHPDTLTRLELKTVVSERSVGDAFSGIRSVTVELSFFPEGYATPVLFVRKAMITRETIASASFLQEILESAVNEAVWGFLKYPLAWLKQ